MSTPTSTAPDEPARIQRAAAAALRRAGGGDASTRALHAAQVGEPALVRAPGGEPAFWLVPLLIGERACGYARVGLDGQVAQLSQFGAGEAAWPPAAYFKQVPAAWLAEIRARHPGEAVAEPVLSYDGSPAKWAWRIGLGDGACVAYVVPGGWYEKPPSGQHGVT
jgi:hypothetical protein